MYPQNSSLDTQHPSPTQTTNGQENLAQAVEYKQKETTKDTLRGHCWEPNEFQLSQAGFNWIFAALQSGFWPRYGNETIPVALTDG